MLMWPSTAESALTVSITDRPPLHLLRLALPYALDAFLNNLAYVHTPLNTVTYT